MAPSFSIVLYSEGCIHKSPFSHKEFIALLDYMRHHTGNSGASVELSLMHDNEIEQVHHDALGLDGPTNILAFPAAENEHPTQPQWQTNEAKETVCCSSLGLLALSIDAINREAFLYQQPHDQHAIRLLVHGFSHLLGFDHGPAMDAVCNELENAVLTHWKTLQ